MQYACGVRSNSDVFQERCEVLENRVVACGHSVLTVATRDIARHARAGQFAQILVPGGAVFLPRPFSFLAAERSRCAFLSRVVGPGTRALASLRAGTQVDLLGPLGQGFDLTAAAAGEVILVGGGVGVPPLVHAAAELAPLTGTALIGAARGEFLLCEQEFAALGWQVQLATDDGSRGHHGLVTELLEQALARASVRDAAVPAPATTQPHAEQTLVGGAGRQAATGPSSSAQAPWDASHAPVRAVRWAGAPPCWHAVPMPCCTAAPNWRPRPAPPARSPWRSRWPAASASASAAPSASTPPIPTPPPRMPWSAATAPSSPLIKSCGEGENESNGFRNARVCQPKKPSGLQ